MLQGTIEELTEKQKGLDDKLRELTSTKSMNEKQVTERRAELKAISDAILEYTRK